MSGFFEELKRRKVVRVAIAYVIVAWILIQVIISVEAPLALPDWADTLIIVLLVAGFPVTLILAWVFDVTPDGIKKTDSDDEPRAATPGTGETATDAPADAPSDQSIAVLPFVNMSSDPEQEYFSDGISEELLNQLTKLGGLRVAGRTSSFFFKGKNEDLRTVGEKLNVAHILEGSVRKSGNRVRITAQLIKVADGYHLWSENFDRELDDVFAIQEQTAKAVADALSITLGVGAVGLDEGSTRNFEAYDAYLAGLAVRRDEGRENYEKAIRKLEQAVRLDPEFANAWSELAYTCWFAATGFIPERATELLDQYNHAAEQALRIAPDSVAGLIANSIRRYRHDGPDWIEARRCLNRALDIAPADPRVNQVNGSFSLDAGDGKRGLESFTRLIQVEPLSVAGARFMGHAYELVGDLDEAMRQYEHATTLPGDHGLIHGVMTALAMARGDRDLVRRSSEKLLTSSVLPPDNQRLSSRMHEMLDSPEEARAELRRMFDDKEFAIPIVRLVIPVYASYFGDEELALESYKSVAETSLFISTLIWRPVHREMRRLPGFKDFVRDLGLDYYWRTTGNWGDFCRPVGENDFEVYR